MRTENFINTGESLYPIVVQKTKRHRISTTISSKHWEILKKHAEELETQQKTLEVALESLENGSNKGHAPSPEETLRMRLFGMGSACFTHRDVFNEFIRTSDLEGIREIFKDAPQMIEWYHQKPLKKCSLKEIMDAIVIYFRAGYWVDSINYTENGDHYYLKMLHSFHPKCSEISKILCESLCNAYGVKIECELSEKNTVFVKIYKIHR